tara:strand:- start:83 stop:433 length:351 start_codon:yes stop_codon:yes gene_type:complete
MGYSIKKNIIDMKTIAQRLNIKEFPFEIKGKNGNIIYYEDSDGDWYKKEYDSNGNKIYFENSNGNYCKIEYNSIGNVTYREEDDGTWYKKEYDSNDNLIYREDSDGVITKFFETLG